MKHSWHDMHIAQTVRSLLRVLYFTCAVFITFFVLFRIASSFYMAHLIEKENAAFIGGITADTLQLKGAGDKAAQNPALIEALIKKESASVGALLKQEREQRGVGLMGAADRDGVILGRTMTPGALGDNVFLTAPAGRVVGTGKSVESVELTGFDNQIFLTTARPVMQGGTMVGALFANHLLDDAYAVRFKKNYLSYGTHIVFYTKPYGVYGATFTDTKTRRLIDSYFNSGSEWVRDGVTDKTVYFDDGTAYIIKNIVFPGLEQSPGGALLFIPRPDVWTITHFITAFLTLLTFIVLALRVHRRHKNDERGWRYCVMLIGFALPVFIATFLLLYSQNVGRMWIRTVPYVLYNSTVRLQPEFGIYSLGFERRFVVTVDTGDEAVNVVQVQLHFDPNAIDITSLDTDGSACTYVVEKTIEQKEGIILFTCGLLNIPANKHSLPVVGINVRPKRAGTFRLAFDPIETKVLASDGLGTDVLRMSQNGSYRADIFDTTFDVGTTTAGIGKEVRGETETSPLSGAQRSFVVFSPTHSNESRWYNLPKAHFVWKGKPNAVYRYVFDTSPDTLPAINAAGRIVRGNQIDIPIPGDGIYYFHLQLASGGPVVHYRVQSDMTPPMILAMDLSQSNITAGDVVRFSFRADDTTSGVQKNYYVDVGNHLFLPIGAELFVPFLDAGDQNVTLRVYDDAGNYAQKTQVVHVKDK